MRKIFSNFTFWIFILIFSTFWYVWQRNNVDNSVTNYQQGLESLSSGDFEEASDNLEQVLKDNSENLEAIQNLAVSRYNQKDYKGALETYEQLLQKEPRSAIAYNGMANVYRDQKDYSLARENYEKAVEVDSKYSIAYYNLVIMLLDQGKQDEARQMVEQGLKNNPDSKELIQLVGMVQ